MVQPPPPPPATNNNSTLAAAGAFVTLNEPEEVKVCIL
jgi:hypothetical protein